MPSAPAPPAAGPDDRREAPPGGPGRRGGRFAALLDRLSIHGTGRRLVVGTGWSAAGKVAAHGLSVVTWVVLARLLGSAGLGEVAMVQSVTAAFGVVAGLGLGLTTTRAIAELRASDPDAAAGVRRACTGVALASGTLVCLAAFAAATPLARGLLANAELATPLRFAAVLTLIGAVNGVQVGVLSGFEAFSVVARLSLVGALATLALAGAGARLAGVPGAVAGFVGAGVLSVVLHGAAAARESRRHGLPTRPAGRFDARRWLWGLALPGLLSGSLVAPVLWLGSSILARSAGGYAELGVYAAAGQWRTALLLIPSAIGAAGLPVLASLHGAGDRRGYRRVFLSTLAGSVAIAAGCAVVLSAASPLLALLYGRDFRGSAPVFAVIALAGVLAAGNDMIGNVIATSRSMWVGLAMNAAWGAAFLLGALWLAPRGGALGLATALALSYAAHSVWQGAYAWRRLR